jgi:putative transposase
MPGASRQPAWPNRSQQVAAPRLDVQVFRTEGIAVIQTPFRSPQANAHAEPFVRPARTECLDWLLIVGPRHLDGVLHIYVDHYNTERPHRALGRCPPVATEPPTPPPRLTAVQQLKRRDRLGGLRHAYHLAAA